MSTPGRQDRVFTLMRHLSTSGSSDTFHLKKVLIANRGEIALRITRAAHLLGMESVAVYHAADKLSLHTQATTGAYAQATVYAMLHVGHSKRA